jgi:hypothetical protein
VLRGESKRDAGAVQSLLKRVAAMGEGNRTARKDGAVPDGDEQLYASCINSCNFRAINADATIVEINSFQFSALFRNISNTDI